MTNRLELPAIAAVMVAIAIAMTWPLASRAGGGLPGGLGDPLLNTFVLAWDADRLRNGLHGLWDAPFFFPQHGTLAYSEHLLGIAIFTAPVQWLTGNPVLAYNLAVLGSYVLAGLGMYLLARSVWGRRDAAVIAAVAFACAPHRVMHAGHLQVLASGWMPIGLWQLHRYFATGSRRALALFGAAFVVQGLSNGYYLYFFAVPAAIVVVAELARLATRRQTGAGTSPRIATGRALRDLAIAGAGILIAFAPVAWAYARVRAGGGLRRAVAEMASYSAVLSDYARIPDSLWGWQGHLAAGSAERALFPGVLTVALAAVGLVTARRRDRPGASDPARHWTWHVGLYAAILVVAFWMSLGPGVVGPYRWLVAVLPGFDGLRVPARMVVVVALALTVLASAGAARLLARLRPALAAFVASAIAAAIAVEGYGGPMRVDVFDPAQRGERSVINAWLRRSPPGGVIELPISGPDLAPATLTYQYNALLHGHAVVNGYSGTGYLLQDFLGGPGTPLADPDAVAGVLQGLRAIGVRYVVLHDALFDGRVMGGASNPIAIARAINAAGPQVAERRRFTGAMAWRLADTAPESAWDGPPVTGIPAAAIAATASGMADRVRYAFDRDPDTRWFSGGPQQGDEWLRLEFDRDRDVARLQFVTNRFGVADYPRHLVVEGEAAGGPRRVLFDGSILASLVQGAALGRYPSARADLPPNKTRILWLRQTGRARTWNWAVNELAVWERSPRG